MKNSQETVFVGLSGGVDSSVSALRLIRAGYNVVGVFIKTWQPDFIACTWEAERLDAMRVAAQLSIPFLTCDAEESYKKDVAEYMISEYKQGKTPNPDVMCNKFVKFSTFLNFALEHGADKIATGHYARVKEENGKFTLHRGLDEQKDQSYFLWTLDQNQLKHTLFPVGDSSKHDIRKEAKRARLLTSTKKDSQGVCFLGDIDMKDFLSHYINVEEGDVVDEHNNVVGKHLGSLYYTIGQRQGFTVVTHKTSSTPHYVVAKDIKRNTLTVSSIPPKINVSRIELSDVNLIAKDVSKIKSAQFRYRQKPFNVSYEIIDATHGILTVQDENIDAPSVGQSCVFYNNDECLGGGIIQTTYENRKS